MVYLSILRFFFQKLRPLTSASRTNTQFGSGCICESCLEPGFGYQTTARMKEDTSDVLDSLMYHECLSTSLLSLQIAARIMQEKC